VKNPILLVSGGIAFVKKLELCGVLQLSGSRIGQLGLVRRNGLV
jgi:hypothetical protein